MSAKPEKRQRKPKKQKTARYLAHAITLEECGPPRLVTWTILVVSLLVIGAVAWSVVMDIDEAAMADGSVLPAGSVHVVQHLEGGIVAEILVKDGDVVDQNQVLVRLDEAAPLSELQQTKTRMVGLELRAERLRAFAMGRKPKFEAFKPQFAELVRDQQQIFDLQQLSFDKQRAVLENEISEKRADLKSLKRRKQALAKKAELLEEELTMRKPLLEKGLVSRIAYLDTQRELSEAQADVAEITGSIDRNREEVRNVQGRLHELESRLRNEAVIEMGQVTAELAEVKEILGKLRDRVARLEVRAPVYGVVKGLQTKTIGGVLPAGGVIGEIVPMNEELVVEAEINPRDIGHLVPGQKVSVRVSTFDFAQFGGIDGTLERISASTFVDDEGKTHYRGIVKLAQNHVGKNPEANLVLPGMEVQTVIFTGERSLFEYLIRPVYKAATAAFHER